MPKKGFGGLISKARETVREYSMLNGGETVMAAVSGGVDSMVMLHLLCSLREELSLEIITAHLNHNLRGRESERDFNFVKKASKALGLRFVGRRLRPGALRKKGVSAQEAAREARYRFLDEAASKYGAGKVALGHTADDQAETVLMRLIKGSGLKGLSGIPPVRSVYIRPLIGVTREEVERYAGENGVGYVVDSSNLTAKYLRNDIRLRLIPFLKKGYNPSIIESLSRTAGVLRTDEEFLSSAAEAAMKDAVLEREGDSIVLDRKALLKLHDAVSSRVFIEAMEGLGVFEVYSSHIAPFLKILRGGRPNASYGLPGGVRLLREYGRMELSRVKGVKTHGRFDLELKVPGRTAVKGSFSIEAAILKKPPLRFEGEPAAYFDYDALCLPLRIRPMRPGDRMAPLGMEGHKKIKEIFIEKKVPLAERRRTPVLFSGKDALWVAGIRRSGLYRVGKGTGRVLRVEFKKEALRKVL